MLKLIFLCVRRGGMSPAEYAAHLLQRHAPLALRHHASLRRYVLNVVEESVGDVEPIDSLNALGYASLEDFEMRNYDSPEGERTVIEDHARFLGGAAGYATRECVALAGGKPGVKWICALRRTERLSAEVFATRLETEVVPEILAGQPGVTSVVIDRVERRLYDTGRDWDAFLELGYADPARAPLHPFDSFDCAVSLRGRIARLCDATAVWRVAEHVLRA
jgi:hypothetical protein